MEGSRLTKGERRESCPRKIKIKPKPPFKPVFQVAASREGSDIRILNEPVGGSSLFLVKYDKAPVSPPVFHSWVLTSKL
jgi:site-specific DNA recombinase